MKKSKLTLVLALLVFLFLFLPLMIVIVTSFNSGEAIEIPLRGFSLRWYANIFQQSEFIKGFELSFTVALLATLLSLLVGIPAAYVLSRKGGKRSKKWRSFFLSPSLIPGIVLGFAIYRTVIVRLQVNLFLALLIAHLLVSLPYAVRIIGNAMEQLDPSMEEVAWTLGMNRRRTFLTVVLPNIRSAIFASSLLSFINSFNNIPLSMFLTGPNRMTLPTAMINYIEFNYNPTVSAISAVLMLLTLLLMILIEKTLGLSSMSR